jgi:hypothetical protein
MTTAEGLSGEVITRAKREFYAAPQNRSTIFPSSSTTIPRSYLALRRPLLLARIGLEEFLVVLSAHPAIEYSRRIALVVSSEAIAQHY